MNQNENFLDGLMRRRQQTNQNTGMGTNQAKLGFNLRDVYVDCAGQTVGSAFAANRNALQIPGNRDVSIRSGGVPVSTDSIIEPGKTYVASATAEAKG